MTSKNLKMKKDELIKFSPKILKLRPFQSLIYLNFASTKLPS